MEGRIRVDMRTISSPEKLAHPRCFDEMLSTFWSGDVYFHQAMNTLIL